MKTQSKFVLAVTSGVMSLASTTSCLAQDAIPVVPVTPAQDVAPANNGSYTTTTTEEKETIKPEHHDHGLVPETVGVTGKAVKETVGLPGKVVKETTKALF